MVLAGDIVLARMQLGGTIRLQWQLCQALWHDTKRQMHVMNGTAAALFHLTSVVQETSAATIIKCIGAGIMMSQPSLSCVVSSVVPHSTTGIGGQSLMARVWWQFLLQHNLKTCSFVNVYILTMIVLSFVYFWFILSCLNFKNKLFTSMYVQHKIKHHNYTVCMYL